VRIGAGSKSKIEWKTERVAIGGWQERSHGDGLETEPRDVLTWSQGVVARIYWDMTIGRRPELCADFPRHWVLSWDAVCETSSV
jgi:hypothetical protein